MAGRKALVLASALALLSVSSVSSVSSAEPRGDAKSGTVVVVVEGKGGESLADWLEDALATPDKTDVAAAFRKAIHTKGTPSLRAAATTATRDTQLVARVHTAAEQTGVDAAVLVDVQRKPNTTKIHVWKIDRRLEGALLDREIVLSPPGSDLEQARAVIALARPPSGEAAKTAGEHGDDASASPPPAAPDVSAAAPTNDAPPDRDMTPTAPPQTSESLLSVQAGLGVAMRHFSYAQRVTTTLRAYDLAAAPTASIAAVVYPLAFTHVPVIRDFGITGDYARIFTFSSEDSAGNHVGSTWQSFDVGATQRIALTRALVANVNAGYGENSFDFDQNLLPGGTGQLPSADYRFVRAGADLRFDFLSVLSAFGGGSYLDILGTGYLAALFPRQNVGGLEGHLGASYMLARSWELSLSAAYMRIFTSANSVPGDTTVVGGALDEQTRIMAGLAYRM